MRIKEIVLAGLIHDRLVEYEEMERIMNSKLPITEMKGKILNRLQKVVNLNSMISEWRKITEVDESKDIKTHIEKILKDE